MLCIPNELRQFQRIFTLWIAIAWMVFYYLRLSYWRKKRVDSSYLPSFLCLVFCLVQQDIALIIVNKRLTICVLFFIYFKGIREKCLMILFVIAVTRLYLMWFKRYYEGFSFRCWGMNFNRRKLHFLSSLNASSCLRFN